MKLLLKVYRFALGPAGVPYEIKKQCRNQHEGHESALKTIYLCSESVAKKTTGCKEGQDKNSPLVWQTGMSMTP
jgi:hypothetical protein